MNSIAAEGAKHNWSGKSYVVQSLPPGGDGTAGEYVALIRTRRGDFGKFHATCKKVPVGISDHELEWEYFVEFDDGNTGRQRCKDSAIKPRKTFRALLDEIVPDVS